MSEVLKYKPMRDIFTKMFAIIGKEKELENFNFSEPNWYHKHEWTEDQENEFIGWLAKYFKSNYKKSEFKEAFSFDSRFESNPTKMAYKFTMDFGWKTKLK